jgi:hypothetical protein
MHMSRLGPITRLEEEAIGNPPEDRWHRPTVPEPIAALKSRSLLPNLMNGVTPSGLAAAYNSVSD